MKIDIHVHTKKTKKGDSENRNIDAERFNEIIRETEVRILAITNHNHFDIEQYQQISEKVKDICQIWPGVELDIREEGRRGHLIIIVNPKKSQELNEILADLLKDTTADDFAISIDDTIKYFDHLEPIYIAHYHAKTPNLLDADIDKITNAVNNPKRVLKEATNSISTGIYISHGHSSIYGSDVQNWDEYEEISKILPDIRLPVESFDQFCLLLEKDISTINTLLNKKTKESIQLNPFGAAELIDIDIYNDINIFFGSKGTGKTEILKALSRYYNDKGISNTVYESNTLNLKEIFDLKGRHFNTSVENFNIDNCTKEIESIRSSNEKNITSISSYIRYFSDEQTNRISRKLKIKDFTPLDESSSERNFNDIVSSLTKVIDFIIQIESDLLLKKTIGQELFKELTSVLNKILDKLKKESEKRIIDYRSITLFNQIIEVFVEEISKKTGQPKKPINTGFTEYASNRIKIERDLKKVLLNISKPISYQSEYVGDLGEKGKLYCKTNLVIQNGSFVDGSYSPVKNVTKNPQKYVAAKLGLIFRHLYSNSLFEKITELKEIESSETIKSISDLLQFNRHFTVDNNPYTPSSGESSMVLLHNELLEDKEIYIIDEPEKSLGNDYISDVIVPMLKEKALMGRRIIIATHDANIAVRTLPYNSVYREHNINGYYTFSGNPFSNNLICKNGSKDNLDWKEISMKTLEGGKEAFGERGKIYGN